MILNKQSNCNFKDQLKVLLKIIIVITLITLILNILFRNIFLERRNITVEINVMVEEIAKKILEDMYNAPFIMEAVKKDRVTVLFGGARRMYGNSIYTIDFISSQKTILIYWEMINDSIRIKRIQNNNTREIIFEYSVTTID